MVWIPIMFYSILIVWFIFAYMNKLSLFVTGLVPLILIIVLIIFDWLSSIYSVYVYKKSVKKYMEIQNNINEKLISSNIYIERVFFPDRVFRIYSANGNLIKEVKIEKDSDININSVDEMHEYMKIFTNKKDS